jgi:uncharacterized protein YggU (UPF0235/DUF167 family)
MKIQVLVKTNSKIESVEATPEGVYLVRVRTPPTEGKANIRVRELLAEHFHLPKSSVTLTSGPKSKKKTYEIK